MIFINMIIAILIICSISPLKNIEFNSFLSKDVSTSINGIFVLLVFSSHVNSYIKLTSSVADKMYEWFWKGMGQLCVTTFLFFSGYGIYEQIKKRGISYVYSIPQNHIWGLLWKYWLALVLYIILNLLMSKPMSKGQLIKSLIGWESIGQSNWYIFAILAMYFFTFLSFIITNSIKKSISILTILCILYVIIFYNLKDSCFYNTIICFPFGMVISFFKEKVYLIITKNRSKAFIITFILLIITFLGRIFFDGCINVFFHEVMSILFVILIIMLSTFCKFRENNILFFFGKNIFSIYIAKATYDLFSK